MRTQIYRELAAQKEEQEQRRRANEPRERDYEAEHILALEETRSREQSLADQ